MSIRVTLSANAGVAIEIGGIRIWVDALHDVQVPGFRPYAPSASDSCGQRRRFNRRMSSYTPTVTPTTIRSSSQRRRTSVGRRHV